MQKNKNQQYHVPVLTQEVIHFLAIKKNGIHPDTKNFGEGVYIDGTLGGGGHTAALLRKSQILNPKSKILVIGIDQDIEAINFAKKRLKRYAEFISASNEIANQVWDDARSHIVFIHDNFRNLEAILNRLGIAKVDGILLDLGVSSYQLEKRERGFSFKNHSQGTLDMRMDQKQKLSAIEVVNGYNEEELRQIFFELGEEKFSRQIAREIVRRRREKAIKTAVDLIGIIKSATPPGYRFSRRRHFASKIFRAIRMEVNQELPVLREVLPQAVERLKKGGRLVVISFHSLEDRIVKHFFIEKKSEGIVEILTKKPIVPTFQEIRLNPRAESAKLRAIEKM